MSASRLTRRSSLLLPLLLAACGGEERSNFPPLRYKYLPPIRLNVATVTIEDRFYPSGMPPDVTSLDPVHPAEVLRAIAEDRLQPLGSAGQAVFGITNASITRNGDVINCAMAVTLEIYSAPGIRAGFARAMVSRQHTGRIDDLRGALYDITKATGDAMNVEFEYQVRRNLQEWLVPTAAVPAPVQQQPLETSPEAPPETPPGTPPGTPLGQQQPGEAPPAGSLPAPVPMPQDE